MTSRVASLLTGLTMVFASPLAAQTNECRFHEECGASWFYGDGEGGCQAPEEGSTIIVQVDGPEARIRVPGERAHTGVAFYPQMGVIAPAARDFYDGAVAVSAANPGAGLHAIRISPGGAAVYSFLSLVDVTHVAYGACQERVN